MLADILVTIENEKPGSSYIMPTFVDGTGRLFNNTGRKPYRLLQKIYIINPQLFLGMAGRLDQMVSFLRAARLNFKDRLVANPNEIFDFAKNYDPEKRSKLSAIFGVHIPEQNHYTEIIPFGDFLNVDHPAFGTTLAIGTGAKQFIELVEKFEDGVVTDGKRPISPLNDTSDPLYRHLSLIGQCIGAERFSAQTLLNSWGAGFEIILWDGKAFTKLDGITIAVSRGVFDPESKTIKNLHIDCLMKSRYLEGSMVIRSWSKNAEQFFVVNEIDRDREQPKIEIDLFDFNSQFLVSFYLVKNGVHIDRAQSVTCKNYDALQFKVIDDELTLSGAEPFIKEFEKRLANNQ